MEILYHTLWETVHVFFEHRELGHDVGESGFLYPFLGEAKQADGRYRRTTSPRRFEPKLRRMRSCAPAWRAKNRNRSSTLRAPSTSA